MNVVAPFPPGVVVVVVRGNDLSFILTTTHSLLAGDGGDIIIEVKEVQSVSRSL